MPIPEEKIAAAQKALSVLIAQPLSSMWRPIWQRFEFGEQKPFLNKKGEPVTSADWNLDAECPWRIEGPEGFILSEGRMGPRGNRQDAYAYPFYESLETTPPIVESVEVLPDGGLLIQMSRGYTLRLSPRAKKHRTHGYDSWMFLGPEEAQPHGSLMLWDRELTWSSEHPL